MIKSVIILCIFFVFINSINGQDSNLRCEDIDWKEAIHYLENQCPQFELYRLKKYKKYKIKKDIRVVNAINEMIELDSITHLQITKILNKNKISFYIAGQSEGKFFQYGISNTGYVSFRLSLSPNLLEVDITNHSRYTLMCSKTNITYILNFYYIYEYLKPYVNFKVCFYDYDDAFIASKRFNEYKQ